jgi:hypothetical protein
MATTARLRKPTVAKKVAGGTVATKVVASTARSAPAVNAAPPSRRQGYFVTGRTVAVDVNAVFNAAVNQQGGPALKELVEQTLSESDAARGVRRRGKAATVG